MVDTGGQDILLELGHALIGRARDGEFLTDLGARQVNCLLDIAVAKSLENRFQAGILNPMSFQSVSSTL